MIERECLQCQTPLDGNRARKAYCSRECHYQHKRVEKRCDGCGTSFYVPRWQSESWTRDGVVRWWCSKNCKNSALKTQKQCPVCRKTFESFKTSQRAGIFCSIACKRKWQAGPEGDEAIRLRFWSYVTKTDTCWLFRNRANRHGQFHRRPVDGGRIGAHVFSYLLHHGSLPEGHIVRHSCDVPGCVRPDHLLSGTPKDNSQDMVLRDRVTRCNAKLTKEQVAEIRRREKLGETQKCLADEFGVHQATISSLMLGKAWKVVRDEPARPKVQIHKLSMQAAREIRLLHKTGQYARAELASLYGCAKSAITNVINGVSYRESSAGNDSGSDS